MAETSPIEWTDATWTPIRARFFEIQNDGSGRERIGWHCEHVSEGCRNCYAERMNRRLGTRVDFKPGELYREERKGYRNGEVKLFLDDNMLTAPLRWKKPRMIFVCSMTDLFADFVPDAWIDRVFAVMALSPQHTFQVLTKRSARMRSYFADMFMDGGQFERVIHLMMTDPLFERVPSIRETCEAHGLPWKQVTCAEDWWPVTNVWLGVSAERQQEADERIPDLLATPAAIRFASIEPLLGPIDLTSICTGHYFLDALRGLKYHDAPEGIHSATEPCAKLDWIIVGGESGPDARPMHPDWARALRDQCAAAGVPFFFKQWGSWAPGECATRAPVRTERTADFFGDRWTFGSVTPKASEEMHRDDEPDLYWLGKHGAGRWLDGVEHNAMPERAR